METYEAFWKTGFVEIPNLKSLDHVEKLVIR